MGILNAFKEGGRLFGGISLIGIGGKIAIDHSQIPHESFTFTDGFDTLYGIVLILCGLAVISTSANNSKSN